MLTSRWNSSHVTAFLDFKSSALDEKVACQCEKCYDYELSGTGSEELSTLYSLNNSF